MTQTRTETLALTDGTELPLTVAEPDNVVRGGLVVLHEAHGVTEWVRDLVSALAEEGWLTVAPHLYHRNGGDEVRSERQVSDQVSRLTNESILIDTDAAFVWLAERGVRPDYQGVIGFDIGGTAALIVAGHRTLGAAVTMGGRGILVPLADSLPALVEVASELTCPWLGLYGDDDELIPAEEVEKLREVARSSGVATDVVRFAAADYSLEAGPDVGGEPWQRARNWFDLHLR